ncbi:MAG: hypothetical protein AB8G99_17145 [Planctomycetaceae bacterium]
MWFLAEAVWYGVMPLLVVFALVISDAATSSALVVAMLFNVWQNVRKYHEFRFMRADEEYR